MEKLKQYAVISFPRGEHLKPLPVVLTTKVLGQGQFGEVRVGYNKDDKTQGYAVKIIDSSKLRNKKNQLNLKSELELLSVLNSPNIIAMKAQTKERNDQYIAMEMCNGGNLQDLLDVKGGFLTEQEA